MMFIDVLRVNCRECDVDLARKVICTTCCVADSWLFSEVDTQAIQYVRESEVWPVLAESAEGWSPMLPLPTTAVELGDLLTEVKNCLIDCRRIREGCRPFILLQTGEKVSCREMARGCFRVLKWWIFGGPSTPEFLHNEVSRYFPWELRACMGMSGLLIQDALKRRKGEDKKAILGLALDFFLSYFDLIERFRRRILERLGELEQIETENPVSVAANSESALTAAEQTSGDLVGRTLSMYTGNLANERFDKIQQVMASDSLTLDEKLTQAHVIMPIPPTTSAAMLAKALGCSKTAIQKTTWYIKYRKGAKENEIGRRHEKHRESGQQYEPDLAE